MEKRTEHIENENMMDRAINHAMLDDASKLEEKLRRLGAPYSSEEPGPIYWANFRVRVMEQVAEREDATIARKLSAWFARHAWQSGIAFSAAAALVAAVVIFNPSQKAAIPSSPIAAIAAPASPSATTTSMQQAQTQQPSTPQLAAVTPAVSNNHAPHGHRAAAIDNDASDLALAATPVSDASDRGVSLQELSQPELEAVLQDLQSNE